MRWRKMSEDMVTKLVQKKRKMDISALFVGILILYSILLVNQGLTITDTGYNYGNFVNFDSLDPMWKFSTYLATAIGSFFTHLPFGKTMLGLNVYTGLVKASIAVLTYFICVKEFQMKKSLAFVAELVALGYCWCPTALLYNYVTYFLFNAGALLLCLAVKKKQKKFYILAGVCLGLNVMVRFPNLAEAALILALWIYCFMYKETFLETLKRTGLCILGYVGGILVVLGYIVIRYGFDSYVDGIRQILEMSSAASGYSLKTMIRGDIFSYIENLKWLYVALGFVVGGTIFYKLVPASHRKVKRVIYLLANFVLLHILRMMHMFGYIYKDYQGIFYVGTFFLILAGLCGLYIMFFERKDKDMRMYAMAMGILILITPLGSNNYLFSAVNNIFMAVPFVFYCVVRLLRYCREKGNLWYVEPLTITLAFLLVFISMQGLLFGAKFVFRDGTMGEKRIMQVENNPVLSGMYTGEDNGIALSELNQYLNQEGLKASTALFYYNVPALSFYMDLKPAISSTWPDLDSYIIDKFASELNRLKKTYYDSGYKPMIIMGCNLEVEHDKMTVLREYIEELEYELTFTNQLFYVYR